ncbi:MAG: hypothetical protein U1F41_14175 [Burkholderiales bacterium]
MDKGLAEFSLLGGPLHRLGCRLGLVRNGTDTVPLGLVLGVVPWMVLAVLALVEGLGRVLFSMEAIGGSVRLLVAIPLLFACEAVIDPKFAAFVRDIVRSQVVPAAARPALEFEIARIARWRDAWLPEACFLLVVALLAWSDSNQNYFAHLSGSREGSSNPSAVSAATWTSQWYWAVCMTMFRFLLLRWLWRLALWCFFLWRVSRLDLHLVPGHPDRAGGLGYLEFVHIGFAPLVFALSATQSASLAQEIASGRMTFAAIYPSVAIALVVDALLFVGPLFVFSRKLRKCRVKGILDYGELGERYANEFESKWLGPGPAPDEPLLGTSDVQSLANLIDAVDDVRDMRTVPMSADMLIYLAVAALLPLLPLALFQYPLATLLEKFLEMLTGV